METRKWEEAEEDQSKWYVADTPGPAILGLPACESLQVITLNCAVHITHISPVTLGKKEQPKASPIPMVNAEKQPTDSPVPLVKPPPIHLVEFTQMNNS